ncbi:conserved hypothetical protein [Ricinus communis]|uniref:Uncharacterized protein n=1 Tax=Ricinus communis TaxID=3988 RepID=B9T7Y0_RICCO|nr:conserved hypothetical protein [Ricinus communis]
MAKSLKAPNPSTQLSSQKRMEQPFPINHLVLRMTFSKMEQIPCQVKETLPTILRSHWRCPPFRYFPRSLAVFIKIVDIDWRMDLAKGSLEEEEEVTGKQMQKHRAIST